MLINVYLLFTLLFDVAKVRTLWRNDTTTHLAAVYSSSIGIKLLTMITEAFEKRDILLERFLHPSPEVTSGVYGLATFGWLGTLLRLGSNQNLLMSDLYPVDDDMKTVSHLGSVPKQSANPH
jgi:ATP-binding cassette subfamily C (CFTR/MRP) protein 1